MNVFIELCLAIVYGIGSPKGLYFFETKHLLARSICYKRKSAIPVQTIFLRASDLWLAAYFGLNGPLRQKQQGERGGEGW